MESMIFSREISSVVRRLLTQMARCASVICAVRVVELGVPDTDADAVAVDMAPKYNMAV